MKNLYHTTRGLDTHAVETYGLTEDIMMENAAIALEKEIVTYVSKNKEDIVSKKIGVLIVCGGGNNGADGYVLARHLVGHKKIDVYIWQAKEPKSPMCKLQATRTQACFEQENLYQSHYLDTEMLPCSHREILVDCFIGSGFKGALKNDAAAIIKTINSLHTSHVFSCDVPSGLPADFSFANTVVCANKTITMGAYKTALFSECAKKHAGKITCANLGISKKLFESVLSEKQNASTDSPHLAIRYEAKLLEKKDLILPHRKNPNAHKGTFGHAAIFAGEKSGAAIIAARSAISFGAGLVTVVGNYIPNCPCDIMQSKTVPTKAVICAGPGLGKDKSILTKTVTWLLKHPTTHCVLDADICYHTHLASLLETRSKNELEKKTIITPHPKEFASILKLSNLVHEQDCTVEYIKNNSLELVKKFCRTYPGIVLLLKGSTQIIGYCAHRQTAASVYLNPWGNVCLAKGGSGDVLSGLITALVAQNYSALDAAIQASLALTLASKYGLKSGAIQSDYSMSPFDILTAIKELPQSIQK
ncbi:MAG TPA: NAD(P)H-hydrate dehydratase [Treponemataceae bacterium]|nr:NAD(P)H-hydrate dehydratase [Treponemataceae bacterium]